MSTCGFQQTRVGICSVANWQESAVVADQKYAVQIIETTTRLDNCVGQLGLSIITGCGWRSRCYLGEKELYQNIRKEQTKELFALSLSGYWMQLLKVYMLVPELQPQDGFNAGQPVLKQATHLIE